MLWRTRFTPHLVSATLRAKSSSPKPSEGFKAPDPFWLIEVGGRTHMLVSALEYGRAKKEARVDEVILLERQRGEASIKIVTDFLTQKGITDVVVPDSFPLGFGRALEKAFRVDVRKAPFYPERARKTKWEITEMLKVQRAAERAARKAMDFLRDCAVRGNRVMAEKEIVTSDILRNIIDQSLYQDGCLGLDTITSCGIEAADPHAVGAGPILPYQPIVLDIFPVSRGTHYYADMTRTVFKGKPSQDLQKMYEVVREAQEAAIAKVRAGVDGSVIHKDTARFFESRGYPTNFDKKPEGFIHGIGHGVGIDIHEPPSLGGTPHILEEGNIITVEPGLYYHKPRRGIPAGGIRIEDMLLVTKTSSKNLTQFPKDLAGVIIP